LQGSVFFDIGDIDQADFIDCFEDAVSSQPRSLEDYTDLFETKSLCFFQNLFGQKFSSIRCAFFCSFISEFAGAASDDFISIFIDKRNDGIVVSSMDFEDSAGKLDISLLFGSGFFLGCNWLSSSHNVLIVKVK
jgi:hypothetical protein